jgi:hypothetical protein
MCRAAGVLRLMFIRVCETLLTTITHDLLAEEDDPLSNAEGVWISVR